MSQDLEDRDQAGLWPVSRWGGWAEADGMPARAAQPVAIYTLGRFGVRLPRGRGLDTAAPRPRLLLQALIAFGGREVHADLLAHALWPDAEGDVAQNALDVALHRLRRRLGVEGLIVVSDRRVSLSNGLAWVDAWAFERVVNAAERLIRQGGAARAAGALARHSEQILSLYGGAFLEREPTYSWALSTRERLRSKLLRHVLEAGAAWERQGGWETAIRLYRKGLEVDPLIEALYQRLMHCFRQTGRKAEALATFDRCRKVLGMQLRVAPSAQTLRIADSLRD